MLYHFEISQNLARALMALFIMGGSVAKAAGPQCGELFLKKSYQQNSGSNSEQAILAQLDNLADMYLVINAHGFKNSEQHIQSVETLNKQLNSLAKINPEYVKIFKKKIAEKQERAKDLVKVQEQENKIKQTERAKIVKQVAGLKLQQILIVDHNGEKNIGKFSPTGQFYVESSDGRVLIADVTKAKIAHEFEHVYPVSSISFTKDGKYLITASADDGLVLVTDLSTFQVYYKFALGNTVHLGLTSNVPHLLVIIDDAGHAKGFDLRTKEQIYNINFTGTIHRSLLTQDGKHLILLSGHSAKIYNAQTGAEISQVSHKESISMTVLSQNDRYLITTSAKDSQMKLTDLSSGKEIYQAQVAFRVQAKVSADEKFLVYATDPKNLVIYDIENNKIESQTINEEIKKIVPHPFAPIFVVETNADLNMVINFENGARYPIEYEYDTKINDGVMSGDGKAFLNSTSKNVLHINQFGGKQDLKQQPFPQRIDGINISPSNGYLGVFLRNGTILMKLSDDSDASGKQP